MRYLTGNWSEHLVGRGLVLVLLLCLGAVAQAREYIRTVVNDPSGSPIMVLGEDGSVLARYTYAPFGSQVPTQAMARQRLGFVGGIRETSSLHYLKHRYYNPQLGRFYQPDPVGFLERGASQINRYGYGLNDPYFYRDPLGRQSVGEQMEDAALRNISQGNSLTGYFLTMGLMGWNLLGAENISQVYDRRGGVSFGTYATAGLEAIPALGALKYLRVVGNARGLSNYGGTFSSSVNAAGGEVWTATGKIAQNDFATYVNSGLYKGEVNIISGVHGTPFGATIPDVSLFKADVSRFGSIPGVNVYNFTEMSSQQLTNMLRGSGTTIGAFCDSGACLAPFK